MSVWKGDPYRRIKWHLIEILCVLLLVFTVYKILRAEWPF